METEVPRRLAAFPSFLESGLLLYWIPAEQVPNIQTLKRNLEREPQTPSAHSLAPFPGLPAGARASQGRMGTAWAPRTPSGAASPELSGGQGLGYKGVPVRVPGGTGAGGGRALGVRVEGVSGNPRGGVTRLAAR